MSVPSIDDYLSDKALDLRSILETLDPDDEKSPLRDSTARGGILFDLQMAYNCVEKEDKEIDEIKEMKISIKSKNLVDSIKTAMKSGVYLSNLEFNSFVNAALARSLSRGSARQGMEQLAVDTMSKLTFENILLVYKGIKVGKQDRENQPIKQTGLDMFKLKGGLQHYKVSENPLENISRTRTFMIGMIAQYAGCLFLRFRPDISRYVGGKEQFLSNENTIKLVYKSSGNPPTGLSGIRAIDRYPDEGNILKAYIVNDETLVGNLPFVEYQGKKGNYKLYGYEDVLQQFRDIINPKQPSPKKPSPKKPSPKKSSPPKEDQKHEEPGDRTEEEDDGRDDDRDDEESSVDGDSDADQHAILRQCLNMVAGKK